MANMIDVTCKHCGKTYQVFPSRLGKTKYCSHSCRAKNHVGEAAFHWKGGKVQKICKNCGNAYFVDPGNTESRYCSQRCQTPFRKRGEDSPSWKGGTHEKACPHCGNAFMVYSGDHRRKYCSVKCLDEARMKRLTLSCLQCGVSFVRKQSHVRSSSSFCSMACYLRYSNTKIEGIVSKLLASQGIRFETEYRVGPFYADFFIPTHDLAIECDGTYWHRSRQAVDSARDAYFTKCGIRTLRLSEAEITKNPDHCVDLILSQISPERTPGRR